MSGKLLGYLHNGEVYCCDCFKDTDKPDTFEIREGDLDGEVANAVCGMSCKVCGDILNDDLQWVPGETLPVKTDPGQLSLPLEEPSDDENEDENTEPDFGCMEPEIWEGDYWLIDTSDEGIVIIPTDVWDDTPPEFASDDEQDEWWSKWCSDFVSKRAQICGKPERKHGWLARLTMPGYLDSTDLTAHETEQAAMDYLIENYAE